MRPHQDLVRIILDLQRNRKKQLINNKHEQLVQRKTGPGDY